MMFTLNPSHAGAQSFFDFFQNQNIGKAAPDFTLRNLKGEDVNMTKYRDGKKAIIFFWATWCPHCRVALKKSIQDKSEIEKKEIKLILVDLGEEEAEVQSHVKRNNIDLDIFLDKENSLAEPYGLIGVPTFYFINQEGFVQAIEHSLPQNYDELLLKSRKSK